jgi:ATP:ADP antiporter, AAA family
LNKIRELWRGFFDIRQGEGRKTAYMTLYLFLVLVAYYILKPVSRAMFLSEFDIDKLPYLYVLIAGAGGLMAYFYTKVAVHASLIAAVNACTFFMIGTLTLIWYLLGFGWDWMLYVFNVFVSLFSITLVSQGWLVAANLFTPREAKRLYGILGVGAVVGAAIGGTLTAWLVFLVGTRNLLLASAGAVLLAWFAFVATTRQQKVALQKARGAEHEETFSIVDITGGVRRHTHLQVIIAIIAITYIVDTIVDYQFSASAKQAFPDRRQLTAFLGTFYGYWLNLIAFVLQFFLTVVVVSRFGVGGALQVMPVSIGIASVAAFLMPGLYSTGAARLTEAATRYSFNKTGMELLYLPLPAELRNRVKMFTDIFADRFSRGLGGVLLIFFTQQLNFSLKQLALVVVGFSVLWILLSLRAKTEYITTVRKRLASRRLDLESLRVNVREAGTIRLLEETSESSNPRQAAYALSLLAEAKGYNLERRLEKLIGTPSPLVRGKIYELARALESKAFYNQALSEIRSSRFGDEAPVVKPAVEYALWVSSDTPDLAKRLITHPNQLVTQSALETLVGHPEAAAALITKEWIWDAAHSPDPNRRALAATGIRLHGDKETGALHGLLLDADPRVAAAACRTAGVLQDRVYLDALLRLLPKSQLRREAIDSLAAYGERIIGTLGDVLLDTTMPQAVRRQIPRVLQRIPHQRSVDVLIQAIDEEDLNVRVSVLRSLNVLREAAPRLTYGREPVMHQILGEARYYYEMNAALEPFRDKQDIPAARLLAKTLESRLRSTLDRLFRLLGLRYPPKEIYAAYLAVNRPKGDQFTAAMEFLDNVLERELKKVLLPLIDSDARITQTGRELFGVEPRDAQTVLRELMRSHDPWLVSCAIATAAELRLSALKPDIEPLSKRRGSEVSQVAESAMLALA